MSLNEVHPNAKTKEVLLKGKAQYNWSLCYNYFNELLFIFKKFITFFIETSYLNEEVNCSEPSPSPSTPY